MFKSYVVYVLQVNYQEIYKKIREDDMKDKCDTKMLSVYTTVYQKALLVATILINT